MDAAEDDEVLVENAPLFFEFLYLCPEPVLLKWSNFLYYTWRKKNAFSYLCTADVSDGDALIGSAFAFALR